MQIGGVATVCALAGAGAGIAGSTAATSNGTAKKSTRAAGTASQWREHHELGGRGAEHGFGRGPAVHEESVVLDKTGKKFITVTSDNGTLKSVSGSDLTITEGTKDVTYKDVTVTVPADATVTRNGKTAKVGDLKAGDHVGVSSSSDGTVVWAADDSFRPQGPGRHGGPGFGPGGPPPAGAPAPPAGAPAPPQAP